VRVPENANLGKAKVTFSFDAWKEGQVASSTWEYSIVKPEDKKSAADKKNDNKK
jgi:hypothetical protein